MLVLATLCGLCSLYSGCRIPSLFRETESFVAGKECMFLVFTAQMEKVAELKRHKARLEQRVEDLNTSLKRRDKQAHKISTENNSLVSQ